MPESIEESTQNVAQSVGQTLKERRESKGYTLSYVAEVTRINMGVLELIETGNLQDGPGAVFIRGFIRSYGKLLGMEDGEIHELLDSIPELQERPAPKAVTPVSVDEMSSGGMGLKLSLGVLVLILIGVGIWAFMDSSSKTSEVVQTPVPIEEPEVALAEESPQLTTEVTGTEESAENVVSEEGRTSEEPIPEVVEEEPIPEQLILTVQAKETTWLDLIADDMAPVEILLQPGEQIEWKSEDRYQLTLSNTKHVDVFLNGNPIPVDTTNDLLTNWVITKAMLE